MTKVLYNLGEFAFAFAFSQVFQPFQSSIQLHLDPLPCYQYYGPLILLLSGNISGRRVHGGHPGLDTPPSTPQIFSKSCLTQAQSSSSQLPTSINMPLASSCPATTVKATVKAIWLHWLRLIFFLMIPSFHHRGISSVRPLRRPNLVKYYWVFLHQPAASFFHALVCQNYPYRSCCSRTVGSKMWFSRRLKFYLLWKITSTYNEWELFKFRHYMLYLGYWADFA